MEKIEDVKLVVIPNAEVELVEGRIQFKNYELMTKKVDEELALYDNLIVDEETKKQVKETKAKLNKIATELNALRIQQEKIYMLPFTHYKGQVDTLMSKIKTKSKELDDKIALIEQKTIDEKTVNLQKYFESLIAQNPTMNIVKFSQIGLKINLSNTEVALKKEIDSYLKSVSEDLEIINEHPLKDRLMVKYLTNNFNVKDAQIKLNEEIKLQEQISGVKLENAYVPPVIKVKKINVVDLSDIEYVEEDEFTESGKERFTITATVNQAKALLKFMDKIGITYVVDKKTKEKKYEEII